ncbi:MAG: FAD-dependent oxidoreductase [Clostridiales bacterium]|jgi:hypothetical protein|nr:FAD-dependent oxidoreductase [Clostridiales bacterium]
MILLKKKWILAVLGVLFAGILVYSWLGGRYVMPSGYRGAATVWQEMGFVPAESADGSEYYPYDVVVWGSDPEGIAAALSAARNGLNTLLIDRRDRVGGLFTLGQLNKIDMNYGPKKLVGRQPITRGIFEEFQVKVGGTVFDIADAQRVFDQMLAAEPLLTVQLGFTLAGVAVDDGRVSALEVSKNGEPQTIYGRIVIDASQDADLAYLAGAPFTEGFEDIGMPGRYQASTLVFALDGVNWPRVMWENLVVDRRRTSAATLRAAWGYDQHVRQYASENGQIAFRGFNMVRQKNGWVYINGLLIYGVDTHDAQARAAAKVEAEREAYRFIEFVRENLPGFGNAKIVSFAPELYVRESRHMKALYRLTIDDVLENRDQWDRIGFGSYPVDIQAVSKNQPGYVVGEPQMYAVPFRSLVPPNVTNLLVVGRSAGYDSLAHGSARVVPVGMTGGQAAGVAAAYSLASGHSFISIANDRDAIAFIQEILSAQGAFVEPSQLEPPAVTEDQSYPVLRGLRSLGLVAGGYGDDYGLDSPLTNQAFLNLLFHGSDRVLHLAGAEEQAAKMYFVTAPENGSVTVENAEGLILEFFRYNPHLKQVLENSALATLEQKSGDHSFGEIPRRVLYDAVWSYLEDLRGF